MKKLLNKQKGLTLTELLVVMSVISILLSITIVGYSSFIKKSAISNDELVANRLNTILEEIKSNKILDDNTIAIIVQEELGENACIESSKYGMNIYYNQENCSFEVLSNDYYTEYKTLDYYLNAITFHINKTYLYESKWDKIETFEGSKDDISIYLDNNDLIISVAADNYSTPKIPKVDLSDIIYTQNAQGHQNDLKYELKSVDLRDEDKQISLITDGVLGADTLSLFGLYELTAYVKDYSFTLDLFIKNIYYSKTPEITVLSDTKDTKYTHTIEQNEDNTYNLTLTSPNLFNKIKIKDYNEFHYNEDYLSLSQFEEYSNQYTNNIDIFVEINNKIYELTLKSKDKKGNKLIYTWTFEDIDMSQNNLINITYRYQANNGAYYYCNESFTVTID